MSARLTPTHQTWRAASRLVTMIGIALALALLAACGGNDDPPPVEIEGGDPERGREALVDYGCNTCHRIPGVDTANGRTAPALTLWPNRAFVAEIMPNTPDNVMAFIQNPQLYRPGSEMPDLGVTDQDARDIAAYLFTLR